MKSTVSDGLHLSLLVPGLLTGDDTASGARHWRALEALLVRAERRPMPVRGLDACLFHLFGAGAAGTGDLPVAAVTRVLDLGVVDNGWWLRADPVHLAAQRDQLILSDSYALNLTQDEANGLVAEIMEAYEADGWTLKAPRPSRWYLKPPRAPDITTTAPVDIVGRDIHPYLPRGAEAKAWHTILNEIQILLHTSVVNAAREQAGKLAVNSLWFWGGGRLPAMTPASWAELWSTEPLSLALARLGGVTSHAVPLNATDWLRRARRPGAHLVVLDTPYPAAVYRDGAQWLQAMQQLEAAWFAPVLTALRHGEIETLTLIGESGQSFVLTAGASRRWWRRRQPLANFR